MNLTCLALVNIYLKEPISQQPLAKVEMQRGSGSAQSIEVGRKMTTSSGTSLNPEQSTGVVAQATKSAGGLPGSLAERQTAALAECDRLIGHFSHQASKHKQSFKRLKTMSIALTLVVTLLSALMAGQKLGQWDWIVPVISGFAALSTTLLSQTNSQRSWVQSRNVQQRLQSEKFLYGQEAGDYAELSTEEKVRRFSNQVMEIWSEGHESWGQTVSERKS